VLFFGAREQRDLYALERIDNLARSWMARFEFIPVLSAEPDNSGWSGRRGFIPEHLGDVLGQRFGEHHAYLCGPPPMIDACLKRIEGAGVDRSHIHFDKFLDRSHVVGVRA
jgi:NAD(P)H-flavin reductase